MFDKGSCGEEVRKNQPDYINQIIDQPTGNNQALLPQRQVFFVIHLGEIATYGFATMLFLRLLDSLACALIGLQVLRVDRSVLTLYPETMLFALQMMLLIADIVITVVDIRHMGSRSVKIMYYLLLSNALSTLIELEPNHANRAYVEFVCVVRILIILLVALPIRQWFVLKRFVARHAHTVWILISTR